MNTGSEIKELLNDNNPILTIGIASKILGISVQTMRLYEKEGLIISYKDPSNGRRLYSKNDIERIREIRSIINNEKISISGIRTLFSLLPCWKINKCNYLENDCIVHKIGMKPCWMIKNDLKECSALECRECAVYRNLLSCKNLKELIYCP